MRGALLFILVSLWAVPALGQVGCDRVVPLVFIRDAYGGCADTVKYGVIGSPEMSWLMVALPECNEGECAGMSPTGANAASCLIEHGYGCCVEPGQSLLVQPGNLVGAYRSRLNDRFLQDTDVREGICRADYVGNGRRVFTVPTAVVSGTAAVVSGFVEVFMAALATGGGTNVALVVEVAQSTPTLALPATIGTVKATYR